MPESQLILWPSARIIDLNERARSLHSIREVPYAFHVHPVVNNLAYFPKNLDNELAAWSPDPFRLVSPEEAFSRGGAIHIFHSIGHPDEARTLWALREKIGQSGLIAVWMWDNHTSYVSNVMTAAAADLVFYSHAPHSAYLYTPASAVCGHIPACSAQWGRREAEALFLEFGLRQRQHKLLTNYVNYDYAPERNAAIATIRERIPEANILVMPAGDRSRYFALSPAQRFAEWASHKITVILPISDDLSTRFFDALLCGLVPIVPTNIPDVDVIISETEQMRLGIVRINSYDSDEICAAVQQAFVNFDALGEAGILARHQFVLENHMLINRMTAILFFHFQLINGLAVLEFGDGQAGPAIYPTLATQAGTP